MRNVSRQSLDGEIIPGNMIMVTINRRKVPLLIDSGASVNCISSIFASKIGAEISPLTEERHKNLISADGKQLKILGQTELSIGLKGLLVPQTFHVIEKI